MSGSRKDALTQAEVLIQGDRNEDYGDPADNFRVIADLWTAYLGRTVWVNEVATMMILVKVARLKESPSKEDNWVDIAGYAALGYEVATQVYNDDLD